MRKHGGPPSRRDKHVTLAAISPPGVARGRFVGGQQSGLAGCKPPPLFTRGASSCSSQGRRQGEPWGASPRPSAPTYLPRAVGVAGRPRASGAVRSAANGSLRRGGGGGGGGNPSALVPAPVFPGPASERAAPFAPSWAPPVRRRPAAGRACGRLPQLWCPRTPGAAASSGGGAGPRFLRSASVRSWA